MTAATVIRPARWNVRAPGRPAAADELHHAFAREVHGLSCAEAQRRGMTHDESDTILGKLRHPGCTCPTNDEDYADPPEPDYPEDAEDR